MSASADGRRRSCAAGWIAAVLLAVAATTASGAAEETSVARGAHFEVVVHFRGPEVAQQALEAAEAVWAPATALFGTPAVKAPLTVHLYRDEAAYHVVDDALTGGQFRRNLAFAHHATGSAHVAVQPDLSDTALRVLGLSAQTRRMVAHEATHLVRFRAMPDFAEHPGWFVDGAAIWCSEAAIRAKGWSAGLEKDPFSATAILRARAAVERLGEHPLERLLGDDAADLEMYERYDLRGLAFAWLADGPRRKGLDDFLARVRTKDGRDAKERFHEALRATLLPEGAPGLERSRAWRAWLDALRPEWDEVLRSLEIRGAEAVQMAFGDSNALAWRTDSVTPPYVLEADVEILPGTGRQMNLLLARHGDDFVSVALVGDGAVTLFHHHAQGEPWERLGNATAPIRVGWRAHVEVSAGDDLVVSVGGLEVLRRPAAGLDLTGATGLGAQAGTAGIWTRFRTR